MQPINVYLVRHGQTYFNLYKRMQGWSDMPLTEKGIADGHRAGRVLKDINFDAAYSSDLTRAVNTATYILSENTQTDLTTPTPLPEFREVSFGAFEGLTGEFAVSMVAAKLENVESFTELMASEGADGTMEAFKAADPYGHAEGAQEFWDRVTTGLDILRDQQEPGDNVLLVSHGATIRSIAGRFGQKAYEGQAPENGSITKLEITEDAVKVVFYNEIDNLPE